MRPLLLLGVALAMLLVGVGAGAMLFSLLGSSNRAPTMRADEPVAVATTEPAPAPATEQPGEVVSTGTLRPTSQHGYTVVWVEELGLRAFARASSDRDGAGMVRVMETFETLEIPDGTPVRVTARNRDAMQVEILAGQYVGRRGWTYPSLLVP